MTTLETLEAGLAKIADESHWTQGTYARDAEGKEVGPTSKRAVAYCAIGSLCSVTEKGGATIKFDPALYALEDALGVPLSVHTWVYDFNDTHSHRDVLALYARAIAAEKTRRG